MDKKKITQQINKIDKIETQLDEVSEQLDNIVKCEVNNDNFIESIKSNTNIILTEDITISNLNLYELENVKFSSKYSKFKISSDCEFTLQLQKCKNIEFDNIIFKNTRTVDNGRGVVTIFEDGDNIKFLNCKFYSDYLNGLTIWCTRLEGSVENIIVDKCLFDVGRMGIEVVNHFPDTIKRYSNINVSNSTFDKFGKQAYPMGISLSGLGKFCTIDNNIFSSLEELAIGIELVGACNTTINNNKFLGEYRFVFPSNTKIMTGVTISNNKANISYSKNPNAFTRIESLKDSFIFGNRFGEVRLKELDTVLIHDNHFVSGCGTALSVGGGCKNVISYNNILDITNGTVSTNRCLLFNGNGSAGNISRNDVLKKSSAVGGIFYQDLTSDKLNTVTSPIELII